MTDRWRQRADDTMAALARERGKALTGYAYLLTGNLRDAEDLVQDALVKAFVRRRSGTRIDSIEAYVRQAILTTFIDGHRRRMHLDGLRHRLARPDEHEGHEARTAERSDVQSALAALPPRQRACVVLRFYDDLTVPQIAERLGIGDGTAKRYLSLAIHHLEGLLGPVDAPLAPRSITVTTATTKGAQS